MIVVGLLLLGLSVVTGVILATNRIGGFQVRSALAASAVLQAILGFYWVSG